MGILTRLEWVGVQVDDSANAKNATQIHTEGSAIKIWIIPAREERKIAADALTVMGN